MSDPLSMSDILWYWMRERESIRLKRESNKPWPWTNDPILSKYRFTNVRREDDAVTKCHARLIRSRHSGRDSILHTIAFRLFNRIDVVEKLEAHGLWERPCLWERPSLTHVERVLRAWRPKGPWVTGSYIINTPNGMDKLEGVLWIIAKARPVVKNSCKLHPSSIKLVVEELTSIRHIAGFMAYEVASDLRHISPWREHVQDAMTWAHPGPGAKRGLNRYHGRPTRQPMRNEQAVTEMQELLRVSRRRVRALQRHRALEMRDIEHTLCEYDKYVRTLRGEGRPRRTYHSKGGEA